MPRLRIYRDPSKNHSYLLIIHFGEDLEYSSKDPEQYYLIDNIEVSDGLYWKTVNIYKNCKKENRKLITLPSCHYEILNIIERKYLYDLINKCIEDTDIANDNVCFFDDLCLYLVNDF